MAFTSTGARAYIANVRWQFATTMPKWPHEYTVRRWREDLAEDFVAFVELIRREGEIKPWPRDAAKPRYHHTYLEIDGWDYWTMGEPVAESTLINRARVEREPGSRSDRTGADGSVPTAGPKVKGSIVAVFLDCGRVRRGGSVRAEALAQVPLTCWHKCEIMPA